MVFTLQLCELESVVSTALLSGPQIDVAEWDVQLKTDDTSSTIRLRDPFCDSSKFGLQPENTIKWYLEKYATEEPFEKTKAEVARASIIAYGRDLAGQIANHGLIPKTGDLEIKINFTLSRAEATAENGNRGLRQLLWEVLENVELWPGGYHFNSVGIVRSINRVTALKSLSALPAQPDGKRFNILLVVSRPGRGGNSLDDIDYQLVSRCLVAIIDNVSKTNPKVMISLRLLRPPTWMVFREHLRERDPGYYDLVHLDMHGKIVQSSKAPPMVKLAFCKPSLLNPLKMEKDFRSGTEIAKVLAEAGIQTVVLNACESASFRMAPKDTNLAEILLSHGIQFVVAMAYKVVDEAIEIFMNVFYQCLLIKKLSVQAAVRMSRLALLKRRGRRARYMHQVQLLDFIVPVLYKLDLTTEVANKLTSPKVDGAVLIDFGKLLASIQRVLPSGRRIGDSFLPVQQQLVGRAADILSLEILLSSCRLILVHGQGGCGKSELLRYACGWWEASGWIKEYAFVDLAKDGRYSSLAQIVDDIGSQMNFEPQALSRDGLIEKFRNGGYLLGLDNADCLDTPISGENSGLRSFSGDLKLFIDEASQGASMIIICSRQDTTSIANIPSKRQKYHLPGLSVLDSMDLLQKLAFEGVSVPESFQQGRNLDSMQRVAILLEGNPAAIKLVAPALKRANYDAEALLTTLLYGACKTDVEMFQECRFVRTLYMTLLSQSMTDFDESMVSLDQLSIFWTLMPEDLNYYYWFFYLPGSKYFEEGPYTSWISKEFQDTVSKQHMALKLRKYWPGIVEKLVSVGILEKCMIKRADETEFPAYHVHPIFTLLGRQFLNELSLKQAKFGYVRQILLWDHPLNKTIEAAMASAEWGEIDSHEDHIHNMKAIAMAFALEDGHIVEEVARMGVSLLHLVYNLSINTLHINQRQPTLLIPLLRQHLLRVHMVTDLLRPEGIPNFRDLSAIVSYSWTLFRLETDANQRETLVSTALDAVERWRTVNVDKSAFVPPLEFAWFQLRYAEAEVAELRQSIYKIKRLLERNLADQPLCSPQTDTDMYNAIRRCQLQNFMAWAGVVTRIALREGTLNEQEISNKASQLSSQFKRGKMTSSLLSMGSEEVAAINQLTVRQYYSWPIKHESDALSRFCPLIHSILDKPFFENFADIQEVGELASMFQLLKTVAEDDSPRLQASRSLLATMEVGLHMLSGNTDAAASALSDNLQREARSSDMSSGWQNLAQLHMQLYGLAVMQSDNPDYRKGIQHLDEWWKLHQGVLISKQELCYGNLKYATCYDGLKMPGEAGRAVLKAMELLPMTEADLVYRISQADLEEEKKRLNVNPTLDNVEEFRSWLLKEFAALGTLDIFLFDLKDPQVIFTGPTILSWQERRALVKIMKEARAIKEAEAQLEKKMNELLEARKELMNVIKQSDLQPEWLVTKDKTLEEIETEREREGMLATREARKAGVSSKFWL